MKWLWILVMVVGVGCTKPNPRSCADGVCSDPELPFCDADGALEGAPNTCIAVECSPGEFEACRGDQLVQCNAIGNNFDLIQCELGCDEAAGGCIGCSTNDQCINPSPICDPGGECRACTSDDECPSKICDVSTGSCAIDSTVVYASPTGTGPAPCALSSPCSLSDAVARAVPSNGALSLRLLPGNYTTALSIQTAMTSVMKVVATGARITSGGVSVGNGAKVHIRNIEITADQDSVCGGSGAPQTSLSISNSVFAPTLPNTLLTAIRCTLDISNFDVRMASGSTTAFQITDTTTFTGDRIFFHIPDGGDSGTAILVNGKAVAIRLTNSVFVDAGISFVTSDVNPPGSQLFFAFNTFVFTKAESNGSEVNCFGSTSPRTARFENNIIFSTTAAEPLLGDRCIMANNVVAPFSGSLPGNIIANPLFANAGAGDFHLTAGSPAKDVAVPSAVSLDTDHDFEGLARPEGPKADLGAFEFH